ncbi:MAG: hypothetical protein H7124_07915 [Phycisphaerales bacterium]|nr:hypothetical protein [Hyphomonadaceae bacterium]
MTHIRTTPGWSFASIALGVGLYGLLFWSASSYVDVDHGSRFELAFLIGVIHSIAASTVGLLGWLWLHFTGHRRWQTAVSIAAFLSFALALATNTYGFTLPLDTEGFGWGDAIYAALIAAVISAVVAGVMWRTAYRIPQ